MDLKDRSKISKDLEKEVNLVEENLIKETAINVRLESQVASFNERKKHEENVLWLKRKRACMVSFKFLF
jgi:hypothetical protein